LIFTENVKAILGARFIFAVIDDFDPGVIFEIVFAYGQGVPILTYSDVPGRGLNVMLAGAADLGFISGRAEATMLFKRLRGNVFIDDIAPKNTWAGEIQ
jgi:nucleoside 2-deoxyribosyltransferase